MAHELVSVDQLAAAVAANTELLRKHQAIVDGYAEWRQDVCATLDRIEDDMAAMRRLESDVIRLRTLLSCVGKVLDGPLPALRSVDDSYSSGKAS